MMGAWLNLGLDIILIALVAAGLIQAVRLMRQLAELQQGRTDMERFVRDFNGVVIRAESGITALRQAARDSGDDLEKLVERGNMLRDELQFIIESADQIASRLSQNARTAVKPAEAPEQTIDAPRAAAQTPAPDKARPRVMRKPEIATTSSPPASRAEQDLMQALEKLGR